ncbi:MAG: T9SS type A sorting domain-containing protein [Bacteroidales bacterium]|jgi:hypothetical protein
MKKNKFIKFILAFSCFALYALPVSTQSLYITTDATQEVFLLNSISKLSFAGNNLVVHKTDNSTTVFAISNIKHMSFYDYMGIDLLNKQNNILTIYPNPTSNLLNINLPSDKLGGNLLVLSLDGKTLMNHKLVDSQTTIDINTLPQGIYFCRYIHGTDSETIKIIKQN